MKDRLRASPFICGADFTAADCVVGHNVVWAGCLVHHDVFRRYHDRLATRPAFQRVYADAVGFTKEIPADKQACVESFTG